MTSPLRHTTLDLSLLLLAVALSFASCASDEIDVPEPQPVPTEKAISIGSPRETDMQQSSRAANGLEEAGVEHFRVWSYKTTAVTTQAPYFYSAAQNVMDRYVVRWQQNTAGTTASNTADWDYLGIENPLIPSGLQTLKYWDYGATSYRFFAFAPSDALEPDVAYTYPVTHGIGPEAYETFDITFPADAEHPDAAPYISKLWFSNNSADNHMYGDVVTMEFMKPVCRVRIKLLDMNGQLIANPQADGFTQLSFAPSGSELIVQRGRLKVSYAITGPTTITHYIPMVTIEGSPEGTVAIAEYGAGYDHWYNVLPHVGQGAYQLTAVVAGKKKTAVVPSQYMSWNPNTEYTYFFKLTDQEFEFIDLIQIGVKEWITEDDEHDIYNW